MIGARTLPKHLAPWALASLALLPLARGGFVPGVGSTVAFACLAVATALGRPLVPALALPDSPAEKTATRLAWIAGLALVWCALALVPLPESWRSVLAPGATQLDRSLGRIVEVAPLSQDPASTRFALLALVVATALVAAARRIAADVGARRLLLAAIVAGATGVALLGIVETFLGRPLIHTGLPSHARPFGPFANRNHAASLIVLALPLALGFARDATRVRDARASALALSAAALLTLALIVNGSRGGTLTAVAVLAFAVALSKLRVTLKLVLAACLALALVLPGSAWARRADTITVTERVELARDAFRMTADAPLTGIGLGAFGAAYPPYQRVPKDLRFRHVESEPLELLVEGGVPLLLLALAAAATIVTLAARLYRCSRDALSAALAASALVVPLHACCDFPLRVPGVTLPFLLVIGSLLALADARTERAS